MSDKKEWIHGFFGGKEDLYRTAYTAMGTFAKKDPPEKDVRGILDILDPEPGSHILDWCGGWGRHAIPLAQHGYKVTLLDFSKEYLERARVDAERLGVSLNLVHADFRETPKKIKADYAVNLFTAGLGYLGEENDLIALASLRAALKPGAMILIDTFNLLWMIRNFIPTSWQESWNGTKWYVEKRKLNFWTNTVTTKSVYVDKQTGKEIECDHDLRVYSPTDLARLLKTSGFEPQELFSGFDGAEFTLDSRRIVMTAVRT